MAEVPSIDEMPHLSQRLGKSTSDRIRYHQRGKHRKEPYAQNIHNSVMHTFRHKQPSDRHCPCNDVIQGIASLDHQPCTQRAQTPLSVSRIYGVLQCMPIINTQEVMRMMAIEKRQAQRYVRAIKLILPQLERILSEKQSDL